MNSFQRKSLYAALAGVGALGATTAAQAVNLNPGGLGQVLIYPYYTVRADANGSAFDSLLYVVNSSSSIKAVKVRFLEGKNSKEVIDFNLFLSPEDVWTGAVVPSPTTGGGRLTTVDHSCTLPPISTSQGGAGFVDFVNFAITDGADSNSIDRTNEGYVEIIEMADYNTGSSVGIAVTHVAGTPPCTSSVLTGTDPVNEGFSPGFAPGALFGGLSLVNVPQGTDYSYDAVALDNFLAVPFTAYNPPGSILPDLSLVNPPISQVLARIGNTTTPALFTSTWGVAPSQNVDAVSAVLMHDQVLNTFVLDTVTASGTDWILTFPTKHFPAYINVGTGNAPRLFQRNFNPLVGSCDDVSLNIFDREEFHVNTLTFSPPPPTTVNSLCWEANVVTFNNTNVFSSKDQNSITTSFQNGWLNIGFFPSSIVPPVHQLINVTDTTVTTLTGGSTVGNSATYNGLPVVGFEAESYTDGQLVVNGVTVESIYSGSFTHKFSTLINVVAP
jgi:hypothetical protein